MTIPHMSTSNGFTLIELLISIAIATIITMVIYFSLNIALESWGYSRDQLALQKVLSETIDRVANGTVVVYGIKDSLELRAAGSNRIEFVPPWTDDTHTVASKGFIYTLNRRLNPGTAVPIGEMKIPESQEYRIVPVSKIESEDFTISQVKLGLPAPLGSKLRFIYHPNPEANPDVIEAIWWDSDDRQIYFENKDGIENISKNPFGVKITDMRFSYYDNANHLISEDEWVDNRDLMAITGVEVHMEAQMGQHKQSLLSFISLRNAPMRSGYLSLRKKTRISIPDSYNIHTLLLTNISGANSGDELRFKATPESGKVWCLNIKFSRRSRRSTPKIESYTIEYPPQQPVYVAYPRTSIEVGLNLLTLDPNGLYDYDDDEDTDDFVILEGDVILEVEEMGIEGIGLFIK